MNTALQLIPVLAPHRVILLESKDAKKPTVYHCQAYDHDHAEAQAKMAYPGCILFYQ